MRRKIQQVRTAPTAPIPRIPARVPAKIRIIESGDVFDVYANRWGAVVCGSFAISARDYDVLAWRRNTEAYGEEPEQLALLEVTA